MLDRSYGHKRAKSGERRLAAILANVAGYSRLIGADEEATLDRLRSTRSDVIDPTITAHRGRLVKTTGDGLLVEFASVVDALRCATEVQQAMAGRNAKTAAAERIEFRVGINVGDVVVEEGDIFAGNPRRPVSRTPWGRRSSATRLHQRCRASKAPARPWGPNLAVARDPRGPALPRTSLRGD
jgi:class 3 adenylate cyclase